MRHFLVAGAAILIAGAASAAQAGAPIAGDAYGFGGNARWFFNSRPLPGGQAALQFTDITEGTVRLLRNQDGWYVGGDNLTSFDPPRLRVRFLEGAMELCGSDRGACVTVPRIPLRQEPLQYSSGDVELHGTLWLPARRGRHAAVVLAQGSEDTDRTGMDPLPQVLASRGFAVLAYDKRGTGKSPGSWEDQGIEGLAGDLKNAFQSLLRHPEACGESAGAIGFSEGPWVALEAQRLGAGFDFLVAISGGASTKGVSFLDKEAAKLREQGVTGAEFDLAMRQHRATIEAAVRRTRSGGAASGFDRRVAYDPTAAWHALTEPFLWMAGEWDVLQDQEAAARWLRKAVSVARNQDHAIVLFPRANHALFDAPSRNPSDWQRMTGIQRYAPGYWSLLLQWLADHSAPSCADRQQPAGTARR